jgi:hypothetical protein
MIKTKIVAVITAVLLTLSPNLNIDICLPSKCKNGWYSIEKIKRKKK